MEENQISDRVPLGQSGIEISPLGVGAWSWGDRFYWGFGQGNYAEGDIREAFQASVKAGINFFDTAEIYARGRSEKYLGEFAEGQEGPPPILATKFFPYPWRVRAGDLRRALQGSLHRMGVEEIDLYQIHWPYPPRSIDTWVRALAGVAKAGLARAVGVSNYNLAQMTRAQAILADEGLSLASNQVEFSLLEKSAERAGILSACRQMGITLIAYSPLASGVLTGKYHSDSPPPGPRGRRYDRSYLERIQPTLDRLHEIGTSYGGKSPAQVALNWVMRKGAVPIPGAKTRVQAIENAGALGWSLSPEDVATLDTLSPNLNP